MPEAAELTGREGLLVFGDFSNLSNEEFHNKIDAVLGNIIKPYSVTTSLNQFRSDSIETTLKGTRYESNQSTTETGRDIVRGRQGDTCADELRAESIGYEEAIRTQARENSGRERPAIRSDIRSKNWNDSSRALPVERGLSSRSSKTDGQQQGLAP